MKHFYVQTVDGGHVAAYTCRTATAAAKKWAADYSTAWNVKVWEPGGDSFETFELYLKTPAVYVTKRVR